VLPNIQYLPLMYRVTYPLIVNGVSVVRFGGWNLDFVQLFCFGTMLCFVCCRMRYMRVREDCAILMRHKLQFEGVEVIKK